MTRMNWTSRTAGRSADNKIISQCIGCIVLITSILILAWGFGPNQTIVHF